MNCISFNVCGLGIGPKQVSLKSLLDIISLVIVMLQETMSKGVTDSDFFLCLIHGLWVSVIDALSHFGGTWVTHGTPS